MAFLRLWPLVLAAARILTTSAAPLPEKDSAAALSVREVDDSASIPFAGIPCPRSSDPAKRSLCFRFETDWTYDLDTCVTLATRAETAYGMDDLLPLDFTCAGDGNGHTVVSFTRVQTDGPACPNRVRGEGPMSGHMSPICGHTDDRKFTAQKRALEASTPPTLQRRFDPNTQSCKSQRFNAAYNSFVVQVGVTWDPSQCEPLHQAINLHRAQGVPEFWVCEQDAEDGFLIEFNDDGSNAEALRLNADLQAAFPTVNGFNCELGYLQRPLDTGGPPRLAAQEKHDDDERHVEKRQFGPKAQLPANTQSCIAINNGLYNDYYIQIGVELDMERCDLLGRALNVHQLTFRDYYCHDDGFGDTRISFADTINGAKAINADLEYYFPMVNGFNCPDT